MNVSREEYERMYQVYLQSVEMQRLQEEAEDEPDRAQPQTFHSIQNEPSAGESHTHNFSPALSNVIRWYFYCIFILLTLRQICVL